MFVNRCQKKSSKKKAKKSGKVQGKVVKNSKEKIAFLKDAAGIQTHAVKAPPETSLKNGLWRCSYLQHYFSFLPRSLYIHVPK